MSSSRGPAAEPGGASAAQGTRYALCPASGAADESTTIRKTSPMQVLLQAFADREILTIYFSSARNASLLRAAYYQLIPTILQQLNSAEWPPFCDHSVTSADVRLASA